MESKVRNQFPKEMNFHVKGVFSSYEIQIKFPTQFSEVNSLGGDWGPNFQLKIDPSSLFEIKVKSDCCKDETLINNKIKEIYLKSPFLFSDRKNGCYQCEIPITADGVMLYLSLDRELKINDAQMVKHWEKESSNLQTEILEMVS